MTTLYDSLVSSIKALGVYSPGFAPDASEITDALNAQNVLLGSLSPLVVYCTTSDTLTLVAGTASYTIGSAGTFNTTRPTKILADYCYLRDSANNDYPLKWLDLASYNSKLDKTTQSRPNHITYDPQYPLGIIYFYQVPDENYTFHLVSEKPLAEMSTLTATISLPPEFKAFLKWNTAVALAPNYPGAAAQPGFQIVMAEAKRSMAIIQSVRLSHMIQAVKLDCPGIRRGSVQHGYADPDMGTEL